LKPIFLITVYRRYFELRKNIARIRELCKAQVEIENPDIVVVWAQPEIGMIDFFDRLKISKLIGRPKLPGEDGKSSSYPESVNLRFGLKYIAQHFPAYQTIIGLTADIYINDGALPFVKGKLENGNRAVVFHWPNGFVQSGIWHTNFFVVPPEEVYWPPLSFPGDQDILEWKWGKALAEKALPDIFRWHNYNDRIFKHIHESEENPVEQQGFELWNGVNLFIKGRK
jgi:hypothetical protein